MKLRSKLRTLLTTSCAGYHLTRFYCAYVCAPPYDEFPIEFKDEKMREVICCDAFEKLNTIEPVRAVITSLPDASEVACGLAGYDEWFTQGVRAILRCVSKNGVAIFYQGDRKHDGSLLSKASLLCNAARALEYRLLWHKIVLRNPPGTVNLFRPSYLHLMAFSRSLRSGRATPDVIELGATIHKNAMGINAAIVAVRFALEVAKAGTIHDPFCGRGTVLAVANALGCKSIGFDINEEHCIYARALYVKIGERRPFRLNRLQSPSGFNHLR